MVVTILNSLRNMLGSILGWIEAILDRTGGTMVVLSAVVIALVAGLFIVPIRGGSGLFGVNEMGSVMADLTRQATYKGKYENGTRVPPKAGYKGKFESRKNGGHRASPR